MKNKIARIMTAFITTGLCALTSTIIVFASEATTRSAYPAWFGEPECPKSLLNKIN